jgi:hypothetical protein
MDALAWLRKHLDDDGNDLLRDMVRGFAEQLMATEVDVVAGAGWGEVSPERVNHRNGYRMRPFDTRVGTIDLAIPKLRQLLPGLAVGPAPSGGEGAGRGSRPVLRPGGQHPPGRWAREDVGDRVVVEVAGVSDGGRARLVEARTASCTAHREIIGCHALRRTGAIIRASRLQALTFSRAEQAMLVWAPAPVDE